MLAFLEESVIGCRGFTYDETSSIATSSTFAVDPQYQRRGVGTKIFLAAEQYCEQVYRPRCIRMDSWSSNAHVRSLAARFGYTLVREYPDPERRPMGISTLVFERLLRGA